VVSAVVAPKPRIRRDKSNGAGLANNALSLPVQREFLESTALPSRAAVQTERVNLRLAVAEGLLIGLRARRGYIVQGLSGGIF
jgi:hypothetical protein